jgi:hypothetical protein
MKSSSMFLQYCSMALLIVRTKAVHQKPASLLYHRTYFSKTSEEPCLLVFVEPLQVLQERDRTSQSIEKIHDRRAESIRPLRVELQI